MTERWTPHATVAAIVERQGRFLMVEEMSAGQAVFNQPAGHVEPGETLLQAAKRETLEETGWQVEPVALQGLYTYTSPSNQVTYHRYCFIANALQAVDNATLDTGIIAAHWMSTDEIRACQRLRSPMVLTCIEDYLAGKRFPLDVIIEHP